MQIARARSLKKNRSRFQSMFLKNYTSEVPVERTIARIEAILIRCGVEAITKDYGPQGEIVAITFHIRQGEARVPVRLPANREQALNALWEDYCVQHPKEWNRRKNRKHFGQQAERTAWKLVQDWVEVQMSLVQMRQAETLQVFMPYVWDGRRTLFERVKEQGFRALLPEKTS